MIEFLQKLFHCRRCKVKQGDIVIYVCEFDADKSYSPNTAPAVITKVHDNGNLDLCVLFMNGCFFRLNTTQGDGTVRETWTPKA